MENAENKLMYLKEHLECQNYVSDEAAIWGSLELKAGSFTYREGVERHTLIFVLTGELTFSTAKTINRTVKESCFFLVPAGDNFYARAETDCLLMRCSLTPEITLCNRHSIEELRLHASMETMWKNGTVVLTIHPLLLKELKITRETLCAGLSCLHYHHIKMEILLMELRGFYRREDLAALFMPILGENGDFKHKIMQIYPSINTAKELAEQLHMSSTVFKRKFQKAFGTSAKQWLIQKKKEKLLYDILMTELTLTELADKYNFTVNYLTTFCKEHFGKSFTELRTEIRRS